jgi:hypothetical protein
MLHAAGIKMCQKVRQGPNQPHGYYEDRAFKHLNKQLLARQGGNWHSPPGLPEIPRRLRDSMLTVIEKRKQDTWGWKDPRNCLTAHLWHPLLLECGCSPRYVLTYRCLPSVIRSLVARDTERKPEKAWEQLYYTYYRRAFQFLCAHQAPWLITHFELLVRSHTDCLAEFVGLPEMAARMAQCVK